MCNNFRVPLLGEGGTIYSLCWTTDIDYFGHMNNGKYFKEMDFGRFDFYFRSGLTELIQVRMILMTMVMMTLMMMMMTLMVMMQARPSWYVVQHGASVKYRRPLNFLVPFKAAQTFTVN